MTELGALANPAAIVRASLKNAGVLIDLATALGSTGNDIRALGEDVGSYHQG